MVVKNGAESHGWKLKEHLANSTQEPKVNMVVWTGYPWILFTEGVPPQCLTKRKETIYWDLPSSTVEREGFGWDSWAFWGGR